MDFSRNEDKKTNQNDCEEQDGDTDTLPADTLAILQEFLRNKDLQKTVECEENVFEEDWVLQLNINNI